MAILDHHPAVRAGLQVGLDAQPALTVVGSAVDRSDLWPILQASHPDVLVLGQPERNHATELCRQVRSQHPACRVVLYSSAPLALPAVLAGAHALVDKAEDLATLVDAVWIVASGGRMLPALTPELRREAAERLTPVDRAILAMLLAGTSSSDAAAVTGLSRRELEGRRAAILATLAGRRVALDGEAPVAA